MYKDGFFWIEIALFLSDATSKFGTIQNLKPQPRFKTEDQDKDLWRPKVERKEEKKDWIIENFNKSNEKLIWTIPENELEGGNRM